MIDSNLTATALDDQINAVAPEFRNGRTGTAALRGATAASLHSWFAGKERLPIRAALEPVDDY